MKEQKMYNVEKLSGFPSEESGISKGVSACFAGTISGQLIMAGGCNFPDTPAADGGSKKYYRGIYLGEIILPNKIRWKKVGELPQGIAYGISTPYHNSLLCIGGKNNERLFSSILRITMKGGKSIVDEIARLPYPVASSTGRIINDQLYVYGNGELCVLNLKDIHSGWRRIPIEDAVRSQPSCAEINGSFTLLGGFIEKSKTDSARLVLGGIQVNKNKFKNFLPPVKNGRPIAVVGACVQQLSHDSFLLTGGVNRDIFLLEFNHPSKDYLRHSIAWYAFNKNAYLYYNRKWIKVATSEKIAKAGASSILLNDDIYIIGGELKPGIRSNEIIRITRK